MHDCFDLSPPDTGPMSHRQDKSPVGQMKAVMVQPPFILQRSAWR